MSQKNIPKGVSTGSSKTVPKIVSKTAPKTISNTSKTTQAKTSQKPEEKVERKPNSMTNKTVKSGVNSVNKPNAIKKTNITTTESKKRVENVSKTTTKTVSNPLPRNSITKTANQTNDVNRKVVNKNITKVGTEQKSVNNNVKKSNMTKKKEQESKKKGIPLEKKQNLSKIEENFGNKTIDKQIESEELANKESSDEQYVSLATLESNSFKKSLKSSESIQAEPPSVCDTDIEDMINNTTDNQINDDFPSDYCDDFEDYESDFEEDEDEDELQEEEADDEEGEEVEENYVNQKERKHIYGSNQNLDQSKESSIKLSDNYTNDKVLPQKSAPKAIELTKDMNLKSELTSNQISDIEVNSFKDLRQSVESAKIRSESEIRRNKTIKRSQELLEIIKLNEISFTNFDLPQINYELFIKTFGRKDTKQVWCQTSQREDNETQTDVIDISDKWTQNPSFTRLVSGDESQMNEESITYDLQPKVNPFELIQFLTKAETLIAAIIDIECDNHTTSKRSLPKGSAEKSMISVWSLMTEKSEPLRVLICRSHIVKAFSEQNLVISVMIDGSVALWDLNQHSLSDRELIIEGNKFTLRTPSYNCALTSKGHEFPVVDIKRLFDSESNDKLIHFGTIDENGIIIRWVVTDGKEESNDSPLSQTTEQRITRISVTKHLEQFDFGSDSIKITAFECQPNDWSNFYCGTDNGLVIRCTTIAESVNNLPKIYQKSELNSLWTKVSVICFNESEVSKFLVAFTDGLLSYYSIDKENPLFVFNSNEMPIIDFKWIPDYSPMAFIALNNLNQIFIWDMNSEQQFTPIVNYRHSNDGILSISIWKGFKTYLIFGCESGQTLVFDFEIK